MVEIVWSEEKLNELKHLVDKNTSISVMADIFGITYWRVKWQMKKKGWVSKYWDAHDWSPEKIERLKVMVSENLSASQMATKLGVSRNSVIGKLSRLGLSSNYMKARKPSPPRQPRLRRHKLTRLMQAPLRTPLEFDAITSALDRPHEVIDLPHDESSFAVMFIERRNGACAYPLWDNSAVNIEDKFVCGAPANGSSYCSRHTRICNPHRTNGVSYGISRKG